MKHYAANFIGGKNYTILNEGKKIMLTQIHELSQFEFLSIQEKMNELARMLGGIHITQKTLEHASELVEKLS